MGKRIQKTGLALGSGSARGWAHIGVIRAVQEAGLEIGWVAGSSIGSFVGAALALGQLDEVEEFARSLDWGRIVTFFDIRFPRSGLIDGDSLTAFFDDTLEGEDIADMALPYCAVATELSSGKEHRITEGSIIQAIRASISIPGVFTPYVVNGEYLVDGGLVNPVPVSAARNLGAEHIIAVDLNDSYFNNNGKSFKEAGTPARDEDVKEKANETDSSLLKKLSPELHERISEWFSNEPKPSIFEVLIASLNIMEARIAEANLEEDAPDILIRPDLKDIRMLEFNRADEAIEAGYDATMTALSEHGIV